MKKISTFLILCIFGFTATSQAAVIDSFVNLDFDSGAVSTNPPGFFGFDEPNAVEIIGWTNHPAGPLNDAGVEAAGAWWLEGYLDDKAAFMSPGDAAYNMSSYVIEAGDMFNVSFTGEYWDWGAVGEWTVSLFYDDPANVIGSFTADPGSWTWLTLSNETPIAATAPSVGGTLGILMTSTGTAVSTLDELTVDVVPEPATMALLGLGGLLLRRKRD